MSNETVMLLSAGIAAGSSLLMFLLTRLFDAMSEKRNKNERFFYEIFPKRLALYEEIIKALDGIEDSEFPFFKCNTAWELSSYYKDLCIVIVNLGYRCTMLGSTRVNNIIVMLHSFTAETSKMALCLDHLLHNTLTADIKEKFVSSYISKACEFKAKILDIIREESAAEFVDNKISDFTRDIRNKNDRPKKRKENTRNKHT